MDFAYSDNPDEYIIACLLMPTNEEDRFYGWPSHITVVPWFETETSGEAIAAMQRVCMTTPSFSVVVGPRAKFGPRQGVSVSLVLSPPIHAVHELLVDEIENLDGDIPFPQYILENYRPHITVKKDRIFHEGETVVIKKLFLISAPKTEPRLTRQKKIVLEAGLLA